MTMEFKMLVSACVEVSALVPRKKSDHCFSGLNIWGYPR